MQDVNDLRQHMNDVWAGVEWNMTVIDDASDQRCTGISMPAFESQAVSNLTYTASRGTLNSTIPYYRVARGLFECSP